MMMFDYLRRLMLPFVPEEGDNRGIGTVELILILVEKPNAKHRYVLCGN